MTAVSQLIGCESVRGPGERLASLPGGPKPGGARIGLLLLLLLPAPGVLAVPYASGLTNSGGTIWFRLNEPADRVWIISLDGSTNALGPLPAGLHHTVPLEVAEPYQVVVFKASPVGFLTPIGPNRAAVLQVSPDTNTTRFPRPQGIALNVDPASPYFGRVYVANSAAGMVTNAAFGPERTVGDGLYVLNSDLSDALGQGDQALTGGLDFMTNSDLAPYRLSLGLDGRVFVCDFSEDSGSLYSVDPDVSPGSGVNVLGGPAGGSFPVGDSRYHGSIAAAAVRGSLATSNLTVYVIDEDLQSDRNTTFRSMLNSLWRHDVGERLPGPALPPALVLEAPWFRSAGQTMDLSWGPDDQMFVTDFRATGTDRAGLYVISADFQPVWDSLAQTRQLVSDAQAPDLLTGTAGTAVSRDAQWLAVIQQNTSVVTILPVASGLLNLTNRLSFEPFDGPASQGHDVAFDAAGNLYVVSSGAQAMRVFSPGGITTAITGSDGTFQLIRPPTVSVSATVPLATEGSPDPGVFTFQRTGDIEHDLLVSYSLSGTAIAGTHYQPVPSSIVLPAGTSSADLLIAPLDDAFAGPGVQLTLTLEGSPAYDLAYPSADTIAISDNDPALIRLSVFKSNAQERLVDDRLVFEIKRTGQLYTRVAVAYDTAQGTAVAGRDFQGINGTPLSGLLVLEPGQLSTQLQIEPIDDQEFEGPETVVVTLLPGDHYTVGTPSTATAFILDDESAPLPASSTLFADDFETDSSTNWVVRFGANNGIYDAEVRWSFDYSQLGVPSAPNSKPGTSLGLLVQVNKTNAAPGGSAGINFYPKDQRFQGDYALRLDLFVHTGEAASTEHALAGLNHSGLLTNRASESFDPNGTDRGGDGIWFALSSDAGGGPDCAAYSVPFPGSAPVLLTNRPAAALSGVFPSPPYLVPGAPGNASTEPFAWTELELSQIQNVLALKLNNQVVCSFTNETGFTNGNILIGLNDLFDSVGVRGLSGNFVLFDNVRVVSCAPAIAALALTPAGQVQIDFVSPAGGEPHEFHLESAAQLTPAAWQQEIDASVSTVFGGFRAVAPRKDGAQNYRIRRDPPAAMPGP